MEVSARGSSRPGQVRALVLPDGRFATILGDAVLAGGGVLTDDPSDATALVWCSTRPGGLSELLEKAPGVRWVQLPFAGVERFLPVMDRERTWTCAKDVYGPAVAEFTLGLILAGFRRLDRYIRGRSWQPLAEQTLDGAEVLVLGAGGIGRSLAELLGPLNARVTMASRSGHEIPGARSIKVTELSDALPSADAVVLAVPLTEETQGMVDAAFLDAMKPTAWLVNVARGRVVVTDDLVRALESGAIGGAALDVTDPEPLPDGHPLWSLENAIITPHVANTAALSEAVLVRLVTENTSRMQRSEPLSGVVDLDAGY